MRHLVKTLSDSKKDFKIESSGTFYEVKYSGESFKFFPKNKINFKAVNIAKKIKSDIDESGVLIDKANLSEYFFVNQEISSDILNKRIFGIDIKQAYLSVLKNKELIKESTYNECQNLPKKDRLSTVGMLARRKLTTEYLSGEIVNMNTSISEHENYFYFCVETIYLLMKSISLKIGQNCFLFFWVDCIFFTNEGVANIVKDCLKSKGFDSSLERLILRGYHENVNFVNLDFYNLTKNKNKSYKIPKCSPEIYLNKARHCLHNLDHKNFLYYYNEYKQAIK